MDKAGSRGRIVICDADARSRARIAAALAVLGHEIVEVACGKAALREACREDTDGIVIDLGIRDLSAHALCRELRRRVGDSLPIVLVSSDRTDPRDRVAGLLVGADDYLAKPVFVDELVLRMRRLLELARVGQARDTFDLTPREREVLQLLANGLSEAEIAGHLYISAKTVATHIQRILPKLGVHSRAQAVACAYRAGLLSPYG